MSDTGLLALAGLLIVAGVLGIITALVVPQRLYEALARRLADVEDHLNSRLGPDWLRATVLVTFMVLGYSLGPWLEPIVTVIGLIGLACLWRLERKRPSAKRAP